MESLLGPIGVWVNVAFTSVFAPLTEIGPEEYRRVTEIGPEEYRRVTEVSYLGYVNGTHEALTRMMTRDRGTVVQVGSALGARSVPLQSAYCGPNTP